jgi:hypothetical protein
MANVNYRDFRVGMAVNGGQVTEKQRLIELLLEAESLSSDLGLYVDGTEFAKKLPGIIGGLQRSFDGAGTITNGN